jgi:hypothetical protein
MDKEEFMISEAQNIANLSVAISEIEALVSKMGGTVTTPVTVPTGVVPGYTAVGLTLVFSAKALHEYAAQSQSHAQEGIENPPKSGLVNRIQKDCKEASVLMENLSRRPESYPECRQQARCNS